MKEKICCFFGHHDTPDNAKELIYEQVEAAIKNGTKKFYVGNHGHFDFMVIRVLREMKAKYPALSYAVVLPYFPKQSDEEYDLFRREETLFPDGLEKVPARLRIVRRNEWTLKQSDTVICYVRHTFGGSGRMIERAIKQNKEILNLAER